ncbi:hypothetical protein RchiOBHm_Chr4g0435981 [Rosa chinensis]|uniref:SLH domain-containing protein n=1 Tax=Rosa chinensis TaxID=74649 RepID=A0A2P6R1Y7_ROSCH|nr:uncharacterized protein LOC112198158 isoform X3 [Rosa chinensis]PRQ40436.1 hypothetical protein RchiOBHm_Chr4g0435981 [Rosa chinensis]
MCSSCSCPPSSLFLPTYSSFLLRRRSLSPTLTLYKPRSQTLGPRPSASLSHQSLDLSWFPPDPDNYGGWGPVETPIYRKNHGLPTFVIRGIGASVTVAVAAIAYFSLTRKGFKFQIPSPLHVLHEILSPADTKATKNGALDEDGPVSETRTETIPVADRKSVASASAVKRDRILIPVALDSTQQEALTVLKKLKIIEDDVKADELCTRREYARWLVRINSSLERNAKHRLIPSVSLAGSQVAAFDDVSIEDPDFGSIQALAEAGVVPSKLSPKSSHGNNYFFPERFVSRQDLIDWKAHLEYDFSPGIIDQISTTIVGFMDVKEISPDASARLYTDLLAGEKSILRKVFGQCKRLQPNKPSTKAQAAVALTSGRISEPISTELMRLKAECSVRKAEMEVIRSELLDREDIQKFWDEKLNAEKTHGHEVEKAYHAALSNLEEEKIVQEKYSAELLKEKAAMDCQRQLLLSLKEEVNEMSEKLASERITYVAEKCSMQDVLSDLETKRESMLDQKSILEAEIEAVRILKSWIEDEARKSQARAKVLEEVGRRWKWDNQA